MDDALDIFDDVEVDPALKDELDQLFFSTHGVGDAPIEPGMELIANSIDKNQATIKEIAFCRAIAAGEPRWQAYSKAFDKECTTTQQKNTAMKAATRLLERPRVANALYQIQKRAADLLDITPASLVAELTEAQDLARMMAKPEAMISATKAKAGLLGLDAPKTVNVNHNISEMDDEKKKILLQRMQTRLGAGQSARIEQTTREDVSDAIEDVEYVEVEG